MTKNKIIVTDREADESLKSLNTGKLVPAEEFSNSCRDRITCSKTTSCDSSFQAADAAEIKVLRIIVEHPMKPSSDYPNLVGVSPNKLKKIRSILKSKELISEHKLQANTRGRSTILLGPTEQGKKYLSDYENNLRNS